MYLIEEVRFMQTILWARFQTIGNLFAFVWNIIRYSVNYNTQKNLVFSRSSIVPNTFQEFEKTNQIYTYGYTLFREGSLEAGARSDFG